MIDFHSHILPGMDDGASSPEESLEMLEMSAEQGVKRIFATSHFYPDEEDPASFLRRREASYAMLQKHIAENGWEERIPEISLGAEVYFFPGIATCEEIRPLSLGETGLLLIEPPFCPFTKAMLDELEAIGPNLGLKPVIAHLDRYCRMLQDPFLFDLLADRQILVQVNAAFFLRPDDEEFALEMLRQGLFHLIGSDCHNMTARIPNLGPAVEKIIAGKMEKCLAKVNKLAYNE